MSMPPLAVKRGRAMIDLDVEEIDVLKSLMRKESIILQEAVNNGYRPEYAEDLARYEKIHSKLIGQTYQEVAQPMENCAAAKSDRTADFKLLASTATAG